jgi:NADH-quinone oxidoreductase subunit M
LGGDGLMANSLLSLLIWVPIIGGIGVLLAGNQKPVQARWLALIVSVVTFLFSISLYLGFDNSLASMQMVEFKPWIDTFSINYHLGVDGFSVPLILLTTFFGVLVVIAGWEVIQKQVHQYMAAFLIMEGLMVGVFSALDAFLFYVFFEATLIPMFLVIGMWGGPRRVYATIKFFLYTFLGSVFMLIGVIYLYIQSGSWDILAWHQMPLAMNVQKWLFLGFLAAFAVKIPMWPVHTWLPDAHVEAPTGGSVILAAIMLKIGGYGFIRFSLPIAPDASGALDWLVIGLSLIAIVYIGFVALAQQDMKKLIAYSSISHMGFVTLGLFIAFGIFRDSRMIKDYGGVANTMPWFAFFAVLFLMANSGLPGTSGFVGEFMVILAAFKASFWYAFFAGLTLILGAAYSLWLVKRVIFGEVANRNVENLKDINAREALVLGTLAFAVLLVGVWPAPLVEMMHASVTQLLDHIIQSKIG